MKKIAIASLFALCLVLVLVCILVSKNGDKTESNTDTEKVTKSIGVQTETQTETETETEKDTEPSAYSIIINNCELALESPAYSENGIVFADAYAYLSAFGAVTEISDDGKIIFAQYSDILLTVDTENSKLVVSVFGETESKETDFSGKIKTKKNGFDISTEDIALLFGFDYKAMENGTVIIAG